MQLIVIVQILVFSMLTHCQFIHEFHIAENSMIYKTVLNLKKLLISKNKIDSTKASDYKIYISNVINNGLFVLDSDSNLKVSKHIDREELCPHLKMIEFIKLCGSTHSCCHILEFQIAYTNEEIQSNFLRIFVDDENDNRPVFPLVQSPYCYIEENKPLGYRISLPVAQDLDDTKYGIAYYKLQTPFRLGNSSDFELVNNVKDGTPYLMVSAILDREKTSMYSFNLIAVDGVEQNRNSGITEITIKIRDINDNTPKFERPVYIATLKENVIVDPIFNILVTDEDEDENGRIDLKIVSLGNEWIRKIFTLDIVDHSIGKVQAQIRAIISLDYEQLYHSFEFKIIAQDSGRNSLSSTASVRIQILNVNDMGPEIRFVRNGQQITGGFSVDEGTPSNTILTYIQVSDSDSPTNQLQCSLMSPRNMLMITESRIRHPANLYKQYQMKTIQTIDRESNDPLLIDSKINIVIHCEDHDNEIPLSTNSSIFIMINDINDNAPKFSQNIYNGYLYENVANNEVTMHSAIQATDKDLHLNGKVAYHLVDFQNSSNILYFRIDAQHGKLYNLHSFDFEKESFFTFLVVATDQGYTHRLSSSSTVIIRIKDQNDNAPQFSQSHFAFSVFENVEIGHLIGQINATDKDFLPENKDIKFYIKPDPLNRASKLVTLDPVTGQIRTRQPIDREKISTITFAVESRNPSQITNDVIHEAMIVITVRDLNDSPPTFRLIDPSKSRLMISIEMLQQGQVCEPIPFVVEDADDNGGLNSCCFLRLKQDFNGLLSLSEDSQTIICVNHVPKIIRSLHVTLIAADRRGNDSLESETTFTIVFKNDPNVANHARNLPPNSKSQKPDPPKEDIRHISMIIILTSLAGLFVLIIITVLIVIMRRCYRFNTNNEIVDTSVLKKNNQSDSQAMLDRNCIIQKNDLETSSFTDTLMNSPVNYYNGMNVMPSIKSIHSNNTLKYPLEVDFSSKEDYFPAMDLYPKYTLIDKCDETYQVLKTNSNRTDNFDNVIQARPMKMSSQMVNNSPPCNQSLSNYKMSTVSQINLISISDRQSHSMTRNNQTSFV